MEYIKTIKAIYFMKQTDIKVYACADDMICLEDVPVGPSLSISKQCIECTIVGNLLYISLSSYNELGIEKMLEG